MNFDRDPAVTDEYFVTAHQIFDCCGVESTGSLRVDSLMDKFAPFVKTNKAEFSYLKSLLDPEQSNPDINVTKLANALHKYSESQKTKMDLDESFNLKTCGQVPQDSDSGISSDGLQILEELQCELKEKEHLTHQLRSQLDYSDRQHEEALAAVTCERDTLRAHLNILREENATLSHVRRDYDEVCERLCASETALGDAKRELDSLRKRVRVGHEQVAQLENDKVGLQELLAASKDECHRINEMYASRQSALLEQNETLRTEHAELAARYHDQDEFMQQLAKEKVHLEMELKDVLNKSNQTHLRWDRSIDVSYTDDQMLTALDSINADTRFSTENRILDEESFLSALKEDQGRPTNMSLFDEIRLSFCNMSRLTLSDVNFDRDNLDRSLSNMVHVETQTDANEIMPYNKYCRVDFAPDGDNISKVKASDKIIVDSETQTDHGSNTQIEKCNSESQTECNKLVSKGVQTLGQMLMKPRPFGPPRRLPFMRPNLMKAIVTQTDIHTEVKGTQTDVVESCNANNNAREAKCLECENSRMHANKLETNLKCSSLVMTEIKNEIEKYEQNLDYLQKLIDEGKDKNKYLQTVVSELTEKIEVLQAVSEKQGDVIDRVLDPEMCFAHCQTEFDQESVGTQAEVPCVECEKRQAVVPQTTLRRFFWEPLKCLFQLFAVICFVFALCALCGVAGGRGARGECRPAPWRWLQPQDIMDLLFRIEYTAEVPM